MTSQTFSTGIYVMLYVLDSSADGIDIHIFKERV